MKVIIKVEKSDLIGDIKDFPIEVVKKMVEEQMAQGNVPDVSIFQKYAATSQDGGGFDWDNTDYELWSRIVDENDFNSFFEKYPEKEGLDHLVYIKQDGSIDGDKLIELLESYGGVNDNNYIGTRCDGKAVYYINPFTKVIEFESDEMCDAILPQLIAFNYTEIKVNDNPNPEIVEFTMEEIAEKMGVDVSCLRIKM